MNKFNNIVVIDNDPISNFVSEKIIKHLDIASSITPFLSAEDAIEYFQKFATADDPLFPKLVIVDLDMPCMNGFQFVAAFQKLDLSSNTDVVMLSTSVYSENISAAKAKGIKYYIAKPLDVNKMKEIYRIINNKPVSDFVFLE